METSRLNLAGLSLALVAGLLILHLPESQGSLASLAGVTLLAALFGFGRDSGRTSFQSLAFALVSGLAALVTFAWPLRTVIAGRATFLGLDSTVIPAAFWVLASAVFWFVDRSGTETTGLQPVSLSGAVYSQPQTMAAAAARVAIPFNPVPGVVVPEPVIASTPAPTPVPDPPITTPVATAAAVPPAAPPPIPTGKETNVYVTMVGEGMNVLRSVKAEHLGRDFYIIVDEMPEDENWEFVPGQVVRCKKKNLSNGKGMVAFEEAPRAQ